MTAPNAAQYLNFAAEWEVVEHKSDKHRQGRAAGWVHRLAETEQRNCYEFSSCLRNQIKGYRPKKLSKRSVPDALKEAPHA